MTPDAARTFVIVSEVVRRLEARVGEMTPADRLRLEGLKARLAEIAAGGVVRDGRPRKIRGGRIS